MNRKERAILRAERSLAAWGGRSSEAILKQAQELARADGTDAEHVLADIAHVFLEEMALLVEQRS